MRTADKQLLGLRDKARAMAGALWTSEPLNCIASKLEIATTLFIRYRCINLFGKHQLFSFKVCLSIRWPVILHSHAILPLHAHPHPQPKPNCIYSSDSFPRIPPHPRQVGHCKLLARHINNPCLPIHRNLSHSPIIIQQHELIQPHNQSHSHINYE
jgi:hypothetical protein